MRRPLEGSYWTTLAIVLLALSPNIVVTTAYALMTKTLIDATGLGRTGLEVTEGLANAGYAFGALVGGDFTQRFRQRTVFLLCEALFVATALLAAFAHGPATFVVGRIGMGLATGFLLTAAIPPLVQRFGPERMATSAAWINIGFFGAVTAGPLVGGVATIGQHWRWFFAGLALLGLLGLVLGLLALPVEDPPNPNLPADWGAFALAALGTVAPFVAVSLLVGHAFASPQVVGLLSAGAIGLVTLLVLEYWKEEPLSPVRPMSTSWPVLGILVSSLGGAVYVTLLSLAERYLLTSSKLSPLSTGIAVWPQVVTLILAAAIFYVLVRRRSAHIGAYVLLGMLLLAGAGLLLKALGTWNARDVVLGASALLGFGAGATVSPALWLAGWSTPVALVGRVFALIELIRAEADYVMEPIMRRVAVHGGVPEAVWLTLLIAVASTALCAAVYLLSGLRPERPDLDRYLEEGEPGLASPPVLARLR
jgi:MFS family permease